MRFAVAVLLIFSMLTLAGCESKSQKLDRRIQKADQAMSEFDTAHPDYHNKCDAGYPPLGRNVSAEEKAAYEAKVKEHQAFCKPLDEQYKKIQREQWDAGYARQKAAEDNLINMH
jgi:hypothetical protein